MSPWFASLTLLFGSGTARAQTTVKGVTTFNPTGTPVPYTIPAGTQFLFIQVAGGQGGGSFDWDGEFLPGGAGDKLSGQMYLTGGETIVVNVGAAGGRSNGGYGGGGNGGLLNGVQWTGGGGGASTVFLNGAPIVVAGGGGGSGAISSYLGSASTAGGAGQLYVGQDAHAAEATLTLSVPGGRGGTQSTPGLGGAGGPPVIAGANGVGGVGGGSASGDGLEGDGDGGERRRREAAISEAEEARLPSRAHIKLPARAEGGGSSFFDRSAVSINMEGAQVGSNGQSAAGQSADGQIIITAVPGIMTNLTATPDDKELIVSWTPPSNPSNIAFYTVICQNDSDPSDTQQILASPGTANRRRGGIDQRPVV